MTRTTHRGTAYVLLSPMALFLVAMLAFPLVVDIVYSLSDVTFETIRSPVLSGFGNYAAVLGDDGFWQASWFSFRFGLITAAVQIGLALFLAIFLAPLLKKRPWLMAALMLPMMVAPALVGLMYRLVLHEFVGAVPHYLLLFTGDSPSFLGAGNAFRTLLVIEILQWTPFSILILYSAYQAIPSEVVEAARMDGAKGFHLFRHIELPLLLPIIVITFFIRFIAGFRVFDNVYTLTGSGAGGSTTSLSIYIYLAFFKEGAIGKAVAASLILFVASFVLIVALDRLGARRKTA
jgi:multiple sugar transport system permease protein